MKRYLIALALVLVPVIASAQSLMTFPMAIKSHPQKQFYASAAEFPFIDAQFHWPSDPVFVQPSTIGHVAHTGCNIPYMAVITGPVRITCLLRSFHTAGSLTGVGNFEQQVIDLVWKDTGTSTPPDMSNDLHGLKTWEVSFTFDPRIHVGPEYVPHGWNILKVMTRDLLQVGDRTDVFLIFPAYMLLDPTAPESPISGQNFQLAAFAMPFTNRRLDIGGSGGGAGAQIAQILDPIPLLPIDKPWSMRVAFYNYAQLESYFGPFKFPDGCFEIRYDLDLHNNIPGKTVSSGCLPATSNVIQTFVIDPAVVGPGDHKWAGFWHQGDGQGNDGTALLVVPFTVGPSVPPPPPVQTCQDPKATNFLGPLPCVIPPPACGWHTVATLGGLLDLQQFCEADQRRVCAGTKCSAEFTSPR